MSRYDVHKDPYCYPQTEVLKNKFNIRDQLTLDKAEAEFSSNAIAKVILQKPPYTFETWKGIHKTLFSDLYEWSGNERTVGITKGNTVFCLPQRIIPEASRLFNDLGKEKWLTGLDIEKFTLRIAHHFVEMNMLHPFREGNGRSQRLLFEFICLNCKYSVDWSKVSTEEWVNANIGGVIGNNNLMQSAFSRILKPISI